MSEIEIIIQSDGTVLIPRGTQEQNNLVRFVINNVAGISSEAIESFLSITDNSELLFGEMTHCG